MSQVKDNNEAFKLDIDDVLKKRGTKLPKFIVNYLRRILHQDEINALLTANKDVSGLDFVDVMIKDWNIKTTTKGEENIPKEGRFIFAANHPLGAIESVVMMQVIAKHFKELRFLVNDLLLHLKNFHPLFVPINKYGAQSRDAFKLIDETYASDKQVLSFPAGMVSRKQKGKIIDLEWKKSFITKAKTYKRDIIPVYIKGRNSNFFYNLANLRKFLGLKTNLEMLYLSDEAYKQKNQKLEFYFGKPISYTMFDNSKKPNEWAQYVKDEVYNLEKLYTE